MSTTRKWAMVCVLALIATVLTTIAPIGLGDASAQTAPIPVTCWQFEGDFAASNATYDGVAGPQAAGAGTNDAATTATNPSPAGGSSLVLDGNGDYLNVGNPLPATGSYTKTMWVYRENDNVDASWENLYTSGDAGGAHAMAIDPAQSDNLLVWHRGGTGPGLEAHDTGHTVPTGEWTHLAVVYDATADSLATYADGTLVNSETPVGTLGTMTNPDSIGSYAAMQSWFNGQMDGVCIYDAALTAAEVTAAMTPPTSGESQVCTFTGNGGSIPDGAPLGGLRSTIDIQHVATIQSLEVVLTGITHPSVGELTMILFSPDASLFVSVMNQPANSDDSDLDGTYTISDMGSSLFDAANAAGSNDVIPPGSYRASRSDIDNEDLDSQFVGMSTAGTWALEMADNVDGNVGTVGSVELKITVSEGGCPTTGTTAMCNGLVVTIDMTMGASGVGTAGNDVILGTSGPDSIDAGAGNDTVCAGDGDDVVIGGDGDDTLLGEAGRDIMRGNTGVDVLTGGAGNDRLLGGIGGDTLDGGAGNDYLGGFGGDDTILGGVGEEVIFGGFGSDTIDAGPGDDKVFGLIGNDIIDGGAGNDVLQGDRGNDTIRGGTGDDTIRGGNASDTLFGDDGDDNLSGGKADDTLSGGLGTDTCTGNKQNVADTADATCEVTFGIP